MRTILMAIAATLLIGFSMPTGANAATGNIGHPGRDMKAPTSANVIQVHRRRGHRHYRRHRPRSGIYFYYNTRPRRYYDYYYPRPRRYYNPRPRARRGSCAYWSDRCAANWGYGGPDYRGCMKYYNCR